MKVRVTRKPFRYAGVRRWLGDEFNMRAKSAKLFVKLGMVERVESQDNGALYETAEGSTDESTGQDLAPVVPEVVSATTVSPEGVSAQPVERPTLSINRSRRRRNTTAAE